MPITPSQAPVLSVFTRTGTVTAQSGDYTAAQVTNAADKSSASEQDFTGAIGAAGIGPNARTTLSGSISTDVSLTASTLVTIMSSASLAVGLWLVTFNTLISNNSAGVTIDVEAVAGTATATLTGATSSSVKVPGSDAVTAALAFVVNVTGAGTLTFQAQPGASTCTAKAKSINQTWLNATGYTAVPLLA
jgi:hypothetical protein